MNPPCDDAGPDAESGADVVAFPLHRVSAGPSRLDVDDEALRVLRRQLAAHPYLVGSTGTEDIVLQLSDSDSRALNNEFWFRQRFGLALGRKGRRALFKAIDRYDLSDQEVRKLARARCSHWDGELLTIRASRILTFGGYFYFGAVGLWALPLLVLLFFSRSIGATAGLMAVLVAIVGLGMIAYHVFLEPSVILRKARRRGACQPNAAWQGDASDPARAGGNPEGENRG